MFFNPATFVDDNKNWQKHVKPWKNLKHDRIILWLIAEKK